MLRRDELATIGQMFGAWDEHFAWELRVGGVLGQSDPESDERADEDRDLDIAERLLLPRALEERYYAALRAYFDHEAWKPAMPRGMALNEQPYIWYRAVECIRAAAMRHKQEEQIKEAKLRAMEADTE